MTQLSVLTCHTVSIRNLSYHRPDPNGILAFAAQELQAAEDAGQRAWIIAHMPPSSSDALYDQVIKCGDLCTHQAH